MNESDATPRMRARTRRRLVALMAAVSALSVGLAVLTRYDPYNLVRGSSTPVILVVLATVATVVVTAVPVVLIRSRRWRVVAAVPAALILLGGGGLAVVSFGFFDDRARDLSRVPGPGGYDLVVVETFAPLVGIDPSHDVRLRHRLGPLTQETIVWEGFEDGDPPSTVEFTGTDSIRVIADGGCEFLSTFDRRTLAVHPAHLLGKRRPQFPRASCPP
jgi:hypothetical protein